MKNLPPKESSSKKKKHARFYKKLSNLNSHVSSLEERIMDLESSHHKLLEQISEADSKVAKLSKKLKTFRVKIKAKDRWLTKLETMLNVPRMTEAEMIKWEVKVSDDKKDEQGPRPSLQNPKKLKNEDGEMVEVDGQGAAAVGKAFKYCFQEEKEKEANSGNRMADNMESNGGVEDFECPICAEEFTTLFEVGEHLEYRHHPSHQSEQPSLPIKAPAKKPKFRCGLCERPLSSLSSLNRHNKSFHNNLTAKKISTSLPPAHAPRASLDYECKFCEETFSTWEKFRSDNHMEMHEAYFQRGTTLSPIFRGSPLILKYACSECCKLCETKDILRNHFIKNHAWKKRFVCKVEGCERSFSTMEVLLKHEKIHDKHEYMISSE